MTDKMPERIYEDYLRLANAETDPWRRTEYRNAASLVKAVLEAYRGADLVRGNVDAKSLTDLAVQIMRDLAKEGYDLTAPIHKFAVRFIDHLAANGWLGGGQAVNDADELCHEFSEANDTEDYPFKGEEYDIELVTFAFKWLMRHHHIIKTPEAA